MRRALRFLHRDRKTVVEPPQPASKHIGVLGLDTRISGDIRFQGALTVDGAITGDVSAPVGSGAVLVVGQHATVLGDIVSDSVVIGGRVTGNVKAPERLEILGTGVLVGDVETGDIMIQGGAEFQGRCQMLKRAPPLRETSDDRAGTPQAAPTASQTAGPDGARKGRKSKGRPQDETATTATSQAATAQHTIQHQSRTEGGKRTESPSA